MEQNYWDRFVTSFLWGFSYIPFFPSDQAHALMRTVYDMRRYYNLIWSSSYGFAVFIKIHYGLVTVGGIVDDFLL